MQSKYFLIGLIAVSAACTSKKIDYASMPDDKLMRVADSLAQAYILVDGHVDLPYRLRVSHFRLEKEYLGIPIRSEEGDFDYERAKKAGLMLRLCRFTFQPNSNNPELQKRSPIH